MWYADTVGLKKVYDRVLEFQKQHGEIWEPAPLLKQLAGTRQEVRGIHKRTGRRGIEALRSERCRIFEDRATAVRAGEELNLGGARVPTCERISPMNAGLST